MKYRVNIIFKKKNNGFSLIELVIAMTVSTILIVSIVSSAYFIHFSFLKAEKNSIQLFQFRPRETSQECPNESLFQFTPSGLFLQESHESLYDLLYT